MGNTLGGHVLLARNRSSFRIAMALTKRSITSRSPKIPIAIVYDVCVCAFLEGTDEGEERRAMKASSEPGMIVARPHHCMAAQSRDLRMHPCLASTLDQTAADQATTRRWCVSFLSSLPFSPLLSSSPFSFSHSFLVRRRTLPTPR